MATLKMKFNAEKATVKIATVEVGVTQLNMNETWDELDANDTLSEDTLLGKVKRKISITITKHALVGSIDRNAEKAFEYKQEDEAGNSVTYSGTIKLSEWDGARDYDSIVEDKYRGIFVGSITETSAAA